jgi:hypothetical protein
VAAVSLAKAGVCYLLMSVLGILVRDNLVGGKEGCKKTAEGWRLMCGVCMCVCACVSVWLCLPWFPCMEVMSAKPKSLTSRGCRKDCLFEWHLRRLSCALLSHACHVCSHDCILSGCHP